MDILLKEALKESVKYPWHTVCLTTPEDDSGITYCVRNSQGTRLFTVSKTKYFDRAKRKVKYDYCLTVFTNPVHKFDSEADKSAIDVIYQACEQRMNSTYKTLADYNFMKNPVIQFLKENQK